MKVGTKVKITAARLTGFVEWVYSTGEALVWRSDGRRFVYPLTALVVA